MSAWTRKVRSLRRSDESALVRVLHLTRQATHLTLRFRGQRGAWRDAGVQLTPDDRHLLAAELLAPERPGWSFADSHRQPPMVHVVLPVELLDRLEDAAILYEVAHEDDNRMWEAVAQVKLAQETLRAARLEWGYGPRPGVPS